MKMLRMAWATGAVLGLVVAASAEPLAPTADPIRQLNQAFVDIAERVSASVVVVHVVQKELPANFDDLDRDEGPDAKPPGFWRRFHDQFKRAPVERAIGQGSGIVIRTNGFILTNGHVVEDAETVTVRLQDGTSYKATVRGVDPQSDVAVLKIEANGLPAATLADSSQTKVGEFAIAIGAPFGFDFSVTFGHVSAKSRSVIDGFEGMAMDQDFLQTDALINPGNSGGPLVNLDGQVIGINTLIQGLHSGIGFAIPSSLAKEISDQIIETGKFTRPYLGIGMRAVREELELQELVPGIKDGVVVRTIVPGGPAAKSTLKPSDIITSVDGKPVATPQQLRGSIRSKKIGAAVMLQVYRQGKTVTVEINPSEWPQPKPQVATTTTVAPTSKALATELGITVKPLSAALASQLRAGTQEGVVVATVDKNSPAARGNIRPGDIITSINQEPVVNRKQFQAAVEKLDLKKGAIINLLSGNIARFEIVKAGP
jgi:serine protease Do